MTPTVCRATRPGGRKRVLAAGVSLLWLFCSAAAAQLAEYRIGILQELTGPAASLGAVCARGFDIAARKFAPAGAIGATRIKLVVGDARDSAAAALVEFQKFTTYDGVHALLALRSKSALPVLPLAARIDLPLYGIVGAPEFTKYGRAVRVYPSAALEAAAQQALARRLRVRRAAIVAAADEWTVALAEALRQSAAAGEQAVAFTEFIPAEEQSSSGAVLQIKRAGVTAVFAPLLSRSALLIRKLRETGVTVPVITSYWIQQPEQMQAAGAAALEQVYFTEVQTDRPLFRRAYTGLFPAEQFNPAAYLCYAALSSMLSALSRPGALQDTGSAARALVEIDQVPLHDGALRFVNREAQLDLTVKKFVNGAIVAEQM